MFDKQVNKSFVEFALKKIDSVTKNQFLDRLTDYFTKRKEERDTLSKEIKE
jgi:hypothetical protein